MVVTDEELEVPLEAQGLSVFGATIWTASPRERLVAHELAHQWFGNSVTVGAGRHIWLNEGFACYAEWLWSECSGGRAPKRHDRRHTRLAGLPQDLRLADPGPERCSTTASTNAVRSPCTHCAAGRRRLLPLLRDWTAQHRHGSVSTQMFLAHVAAQAGAPAAEGLVAWLDQPALPALPPS